MASQEDRFEDLLDEFSRHFSGGKCKWLRCLLYNTLSVSTLTKSTTALQLLSKLHSQVKGHISSNNVEILLEIAELTGLDAAIRLVEKYKRNTAGYNATRGQRLTLYRQKLFESLREVGGPELPRIAAFYSEDSSDHIDIWDFVFFLEVGKRLDSTPEKTKRFAKLLNPTAAHILTEEYANTLPETGEPQNIPSSSIQEVLPGTAAVKKEQSTSAVVRKPTVPSSTGNRNSKPWTSSGIALSKSDYRKLLVEVASWWEEHEKIHLLKFIIFKFKCVALTDIENTDDAFELLELLTAPGIISPSNVDVLMEAVVIGEMGGVDEERITKLIPTFPGFSNITVPARRWDKRQKLIKFGRGISKDEQSEIAKLYGLKTKKLNDVWDFMLKLEKKELFDGEIIEFVQTLKDNKMKKHATTLLG